MLRLPARKLPHGATGDITSVTPDAPALLAVVGGSASQAGIVEASTVKGVPPAAADVSKAVWAGPGAKLTGDPALRVHMSSTDEATSAVAVAVTVMVAVTARSATPPA